MELAVTYLTTQRKDNSYSSEIIIRNLKKTERKKFDELPKL